MNYDYTESLPYRRRKLFDKLVHESEWFGLRAAGFNPELRRSVADVKKNWGYNDSPGFRPGDAILSLSPEDRAALVDFTAKDTLHRQDYINFVIGMCHSSCHMWC